MTVFLHTEGVSLGTLRQSVDEPKTDLEVVDEVIAYLLHIIKHPTGQSSNFCHDQIAAAHELLGYLELRRQIK